MVLYSHSTGCLEASLYMREGKFRERIDALVLNSPFLDWGFGGILEAFLDAMDELMPFLKLIKGKDVAQSMPFPGTDKKQINAYGARIYSQYPHDLRCRNHITNKVTRSARACSCSSS